MPLCIICETAEGEVRKGLEELRRRSKEVINALIKSDQKEPTLIQVGMKRYNNLKKSSIDDVIKEVEKKHITHLLNINTLTIHKKNCPHAGRNVLRAHITNPETTGLHRCRHGYK